MTTISKYAKHEDIKIVRVTKSRGRETTIEVDALGYTSTVRVAVRDVSGTHIEEKTVVFLLPDAVVSREDRIKVGDVTMAISEITRPRFVGRSLNHIEVTLD